MPKTGLGPLLERETELVQLERTIDRLEDGRGSLVVVEGPAGIGKTGLLAALVSRAKERSVRTLSARGAPLEHEYAFGVARRLLAPALATLSEPQIQAVSAGDAALGAAAIGAHSGVVSNPDEGIAPILNGLYWLTTNLASDHALLLTIDDIHWADRASLRLIAFLGERVETLPIALVVATRTRELQAEQALVDEITAIPHGVVLRPAPLSAGATAGLVSERLGGPAGTELVRACHEVTGGNPFLLGELLTSLDADRVGGSALSPERVRHLGPETVSRSLLMRLARVPDPAADLAAAIAVLGDDVPLERAAALAGTDPATAAGALDALADVEILNGEQPLNFTHPIVRNAVYQDLGPGRQSALHGRAAELLIEVGAPAGEVATHLLSAPPAGRSDFLAALRDAAEQAVLHGAPEVAIGFLERARAETGSAQIEAELLYELGRAEYFVGEDPERASSHLREAISALSDPQIRQAAWLTLGGATMSYVGVPETSAVFAEALDDLRDLDPDARRRLEVWRNSIGITHADTFAETAKLIDALPEPTGSSIADRLVLCNLAFRAGMTGIDREPTVELCRRAFADDELIQAEGTENNAIDQALYVWWFCDCLDETLAQLELAVAGARVRTSAYAVASAWAMRAGNRYFLGDMPGCVADALQSVSVPGFPPFAQFAYGLAAWALTDIGNLDEAEEMISKSHVGPDLPPVVHMDVLFYIRARLRAAQGRHLDAVADFAEYESRCKRVGAQNPAMPWQADAALSHRALGEHEVAAEMAEQYLGSARAWGTPFTVGVGLWTSGLIEGGSDGLELIRDGAAELARSPRRLEHARALVELGAALRRESHRREAREPLREGLELARRCGATALIERAHAELVQAGARPRRLMFSGAESLTASERRTAELAAEGMSNREIAQNLFVTPKTVENHLTRAYAKLEIHSRGELSEALGADRSEPARRAPA